MLQEDQSGSATLPAIHREGGLKSTHFHTRSLCEGWLINQNWSPKLTTAQW